MKLHDVQRAAVELFSARGFAATGIREIGRQVNLNSATLYHYTGSKEDLLEGIMRLALLELEHAGKAAVARSQDPLVQLGNLVGAHVGLTAVNPFTSRVIDHELRALTPDRLTKMLEIRDSYEEVWTQVFARGLANGAFQVTNIKITRLAIIEMCNGVANWYNPNGELNVLDIQRMLIDLSGRMIGVDSLSNKLDDELARPVRFSVEPISWSPDNTGG